MVRLSSTSAIVAALVLAGCGGSDKPADAPAATAKSADPTPESGLNIAALWGGGKPMPLTIQAKHPNGVILQPLSIQAKPTETVVRIRVINGSDHEVVLNWSDGKTYLLAGTERFGVSAPMDNPKLKIQPAQSVEGEFVYLGRIPDRGDVRLVFNEGMSSDNQYSREPNFVVTIPMTSAAYSDDGSKKNSAA